MQSADILLMYLNLSDGGIITSLISTDIILRYYSDDPTDIVDSGFVNMSC